MNIPIELLITIISIFLTVGVSWGMLRQKMKDLASVMETNREAEMKTLENFKSNHLFHIQSSLDRIESNIEKLFNKVDGCEIAIASLQERTKK